MEKGSVKWFGIRKGYGFIEGENKIDYFVHYSNINGDGFRSIKKDQNVVFSIGKDSDDRDIALEVEVV